ncbi:hypothetical protein niasHT_005694 [Heterodera trifolii]|uniref:FLYWCH-type domain-containing protein n=1 Tax=Heterodera trifolii TaxID=157864 RepID=A0ABD2M846_9BILA
MHIKRVLIDDDLEGDDLEQYLSLYMENNEEMEQHQQQRKHNDKELVSESAAAAAAVVEPSGPHSNIAAAAVEPSVPHSNPSAASVLSKGNVTLDMFLYQTSKKILNFGNNFKILRFHSFILLDEKPTSFSDADISLSPSLIPSVNIEQIAPGGASSSSSSSAATVEQFAPGADASVVAALAEIRFLPNNNNIIDFQGHTYLYDKRLSRRPHPSLPNSGERLYNCRREKCRKDAKGKCRAQIALYWDEDKIKRGPTAHKK